MKLTQEILAEIVAKSSTFDERLANGYFVPHLESDQSATDRRLEHWCEVAAKGDRKQFEKLLLLKGLDLRSAKAGLGPVRLSSLETLPEWTGLLQEALRSAEIRCPNSFRFLDPTSPRPFEKIVSPFVEFARNRLHEKVGAAYGCLSDQAHVSLESKLLYWLVNVCSSALILEFSIFRLNRRPALSGKLSQLVGDTSGEIYQDYIARMLDGGLVAFFHEYSVLARAVATLLKNWIDSATEFMTRLAMDRDRIASEFHSGKDPGPVEKLGAGLSDPHHGGRSVFALTFSSGLKLIYKPKSLETEQAYAQLIDWLNGQGGHLALRGVKVLARPGYGWAEFVEHKPASNDAELARFYRRSGMLLALFYVLGSTDVHFENLIAAGEHPVLIDAETLITPFLEDEQKRENSNWAEIVAARRLSTSAFRVGMLPYWRFGAGSHSQDLSALGGVGGEEVLTTIWQGIETDHLGQQVVRDKVARNGNVPFAPDNAADPVRYVEEVIAGFHEMYELLLARREELLRCDSPLDQLARSPMRLVFRDTSTYFSLLKNSVQPAFLRDAAERFIHLEALSRVALLSDWNARFVPLLGAEKQALMNLDIPFFTVRPQSRVMDLGLGEKIENCFAQTGYEGVRERLSGLGKQNLEEQISIIRGSFWAKAASRWTETQPVKTIDVTWVDLPEPNTAELIEQAVKIGQQLEHEAIRGSDGSVTWISLVSHASAHHYQFSYLRPDLFGGLAGVALFLAALERVTGDVKWRQMAMGTLGPIQRAVAAYQTILSSPRKSTSPHITLGLTGLGSLVYALTQIGQLLQEEAPMKIAHAAASLINSDFLTADTRLDVLHGHAGAVLGLLSLYEAQADSSLLETAVACGDRILMCDAQSTDNGSKLRALASGLGTGFARGPIGVAHTLLRLYRATNEGRFLHAGQELVQAELTSNKDYWTSADGCWFEGAAGLGLSLLGNLPVLGTDECYRSIEHAVDSCTQVPFHITDQVSYGIAGRLDFLIEASQHTDSGSKLLQTARKQAGWCLNRAMRHGGFSLHPHLPNEAFFPGFYEGSAGVGYQLLRLACPEMLHSVLLWDSVFNARGDL